MNAQTYRDIRRDLTAPEIAVREKVWREALTPDLYHYPDEDTVTFTRTELRHLHKSILQTGRELSALREAVDSK